MEVRVGSSPDSWGVIFPSDPKQTPWQRFLDEVAQAEYDWIELGPYGYLCANADRAFIALNNGGPTDAEAELKLTAEWGFTEDSRWRIFQRWPRSERHFPSEGEEVASGTVSLKMEPWDIVLLEIVPAIPTLSVRSPAISSWPSAALVSRLQSAPTAGSTGTKGL